MDPAGIGALIGVSIMGLGIGCFLLCDRRNAIYNRFVLYRRRRAMKQEVKEYSPLIIRSPHTRMKNILPPLKKNTYILKNLNTTFQAKGGLLSTIPE